MRSYAAALLLLPLAGGCALTAERSEPLLTASASVADSEACAEVRAGIAAFNLGDYEATVDRFVAAVPLARARLDGSQAAADLLEAVEWYAALPPEDYAGAAIGSEDFQRYKAITLGQCDPLPPEGATEVEPPGTPV